LCPRCLSKATPAPGRILPDLDGIQVGVNFQEPINTAIHAFKYERQIRLMDPLGFLLLRTLQKVDWSIDIVTAVPLHPGRLRERGYNQSALISYVVARGRGWPFAPDVLARVRETSSQIHLNAQERRVNVAGAFEADPAVVCGRRVLIVDDVLTTGATLSACAEALRLAGAARVYGAAVAGAVYSDAAGSGAPV
jgi:ComF family protein